jgi:hypothetical protein
MTIAVPGKKEFSPRIKFMSSFRFDFLTVNNRSVIRCDERRFFVAHPIYVVFLMNFLVDQDRSVLREDFLSQKPNL